jgi:MFS family permease
MWYSLALFYNDKELGVAYTRVALATAVAGVVGGPIAACLLLLDGAGGLHGWQWLFLLEGLPAVGLGAAMCCFLARCPGTAAFLRQEERDWLLNRCAILLSLAS